MQTCYRHPDRRAGVRCQRCERPICPDCMVQASVGFQCPECARGGRQAVYTARTLPRERPVVTQVLIALNALAFVAMLATGSSALGAVEAGEVYQDGVLVAFALDTSELGVTVPIGVAEGQWWRLLTSGFLHAGLLHLGMNMLFLWILGPQLERALGWTNFLLVYVASLLAGSLGVLLLDPFVPTLGASGAVFGMLGAAVIVQRAQGINPWSSGIGGLILINLLLTFAIPGISIGGHVGGLLGGLVAAAAIIGVLRRTRSRAASGALLGALAVAFFLGSVWAAEYAVELGHAVLNL